MSTVVTITLNPAIDKSTTVPRLEPDRKTRCTSPVFEPGGGGINVARALRKLNVDAAAMFLAGGHTGIFLQELLERERVPAIALPIQEFTRENLMIFETSTQKQYRFIMPGPFIRDNEWQLLLDKLEEMPAPQYLVASGSVATGIPATIFADIAAIAERKGCKFVLDTTGDPLRAALQEGVFMIKPNVHEFGQLHDLTIPDKQTAGKLAMQWIEAGKCTAILLSMGADGAMVVSKEGIFHIGAPKVKNLSSVGAGDSMLAGMIAGLLKNMSFKDAARYGVASGTAATMNPGTQLCKLEDAEQLYTGMSSLDVLL